MSTKPVRSQKDAAGLESRQRGLGSFRDLLGFHLGDGRENMQRERSGLRNVTGDEVDARFHQARQEMNVAAESIELGDNQNALAPGAQCHRPSELGSISIALPACLDFREPRQDFPAYSPGILFDRGLLAFESQPAPPLTGSGDSVVRYKAGGAHVF